MKFDSKIKYALLASAVLALPAQAFAQAPAQQAPKEEVAEGDIVVTARKVSERLQEAPLSITALSADTLAERGIDSLTDVARSTPGFAFENFNGGFASPTVRGQSQNRLTNPVQNVATFYNGVYLQRGYMIDPAMVDVGQVSVLKGPQSAAFGRNAYAGAINFQSKEPGNEYHAMGSAAIGQDKYRRYDLSVEGPIAKDVLSLIAGVSYGEYDGGWVNNHPLANNAEALTRGKLGGNKYTSYHIGAKLTPFSALTIKFNYLNNNRDVENPAQYSLGTASFDNRANSNTNNCSTATLGTGVTAATFLGLFCGTIPVNPVIGAGENRPAGLIIDPRTGLKLKSEIISGSAEFKLSDSISADYLFGKANASFDGAGSASRNSMLGLSGAPFTGTNLIDTSGNGFINSSSHELRLTYKGGNGLTAYIGGYIGDTADRTKFVGLQVPAQTTGVLTPGTLIPATIGGDSLTDYNIKSVFGFLEYKNSSFALSLEGRYTNEKITETNIPGQAASTTATRTFKYFTPRVTATAFLSPNNRIYVSYARGVKAGGFNTGGSNPAAFFDPTQAAYEPEKNDTFELGLRNEFMDGKLILNATAYMIRGTNVQVSRTRTYAPAVTTFTSVIGNLGNTRTTGFELEGSFKVSRQVNLFGGIAYNNAHYGDGVIDTNIAVGKLCDGVACRANGDISGNRLERNPGVNANAGFSFDTKSNGDDFSYFVNGIVSYQGKQFVNNTNVTKVPGRTLVDASIGARYKFIEFKLSAENLFDRKYVASAFALTGGSSQFFYQRQLVANLGDRRRITGSIAFKF